MSKPALKPVHVKEGKKIVEHNPIRQFGGFGARGIMFQYQGGHWFSAVGRPLAESEVPAELRERVATSPRPVSTGLRVAETCDHCGESFYSDDLRAHLLDLWKQATAQTTPRPAEFQGSGDDGIPPAVGALG